MPRTSRRRRLGLLSMTRLFQVLLVLACLDAFYLWHLWPDWSAYQAGRVPKSAFIKHYEQRSLDNSKLPRLRWQPLRYQRISPRLKRAVIVAEDSRFYTHAGIDVKALQFALEYNLKHKTFRYGGSTISQQTTKNLFLSGDKSPLRKWHELVLTLAMENKLSKTRILHLYLNIAEFGRGIYGVQAAAKFYWGTSATRLSNQQAIELAATLPSPRKHNPLTRTKQFRARVRKIRALMKRAGVLTRFTYSDQSFK